MLRKIFKCTLASILGVFFISSVQAQSPTFTGLPNRFDTIPSYFYIKPVGGITWASSRLNGSDRFSNIYNIDLQKANYGLMAGYHRGRFDVESGLLSLPLANGYYFKVLPTNSVGYIQRVAYSQVPLIIRYTFWQPTKRLSLQASTGIAYNWQNEGIQFVGQRISASSFINNEGKEMVTYQYTDPKSRSSFWSGEVNIGAKYQLAKRFNVDLQVRRLLSAKSITSADARIESNYDPKVYHTTSIGSANIFNIMIGVSYQFKRGKTYRLK